MSTNETQRRYLDSITPGGPDGLSGGLTNTVRHRTSRAWESRKAVDIVLLLIFFLGCAIFLNSVVSTWSWWWQISFGLTWLIYVVILFHRPQRPICIAVVGLEYSGKSSLFKALGVDHVSRLMGAPGFRAMSDVILASGESSLGTAVTVVWQSADGHLILVDFPGLKGNLNNEIVIDHILSNGAQHGREFTHAGMSAEQKNGIQQRNDLNRNPFHKIDTLIVVQNAKTLAEWDDAVVGDNLSFTTKILRFHHASFLSVLTHKDQCTPEQLIKATTVMQNRRATYIYPITLPTGLGWIDVRNVGLPEDLCKDLNDIRTVARDLAVILREKDTRGSCLDIFFNVFYQSFQAVRQAQAQTWVIAIMFLVIAVLVYPKLNFNFAGTPVLHFSKI